MVIEHTLYIFSPLKFVEIWLTAQHLASFGELFMCTWKECRNVPLLEVLVYICQLCHLLIMCFKIYISLLIFCLLILYVTPGGILKSPSVLMDLFLILVLWLFLLYNLGLCFEIQMEDSQWTGSFVINEIWPHYWGIPVGALFFLPFHCVTNIA